MRQQVFTSDQAASFFREGIFYPLPHIIVYGGSEQLLPRKAVRNHDMNALGELAKIAAHVGETKGDEALSPGK